MNAHSMPPSGVPSPVEPDMASSLASVRFLIQCLLAGLIVMSLGLNIFILRQVTIVNRQARELRQGIQDYQTNHVPVMNKFLADLQAFAKTHPDFAPVLGKYSRPASTQPKLAVPPPPETVPSPGR